MKKILLTGLKPTGSLTLGNYVGAISQMVRMQEEYKSYLFIADMHAITVPNDPENKPGISNLINIYASLMDTKIPEVEEKFKDSNYGEFKRSVADVICEFLTKIQKRYHELVDSNELDEILARGASEVRELGKVKFETMKKNIGLYR